MQKRTAKTQSHEEERVSLRFSLCFCVFVVLFLCLSHPIFAGTRDYAAEQSNLMNDLLIVEYWNQRVNDRLPVTYNHFLQGGYLNMPSARMGREGELAAGWASVPPYRTYNLRCQIIDRLELVGNYRIFKGVDDPVLTPMGFGDLSDKGVSAKLSLFSPEDSGYAIPGVSIGMDDFIGTRNFKASYIVATQVFLDYNTEISFGYGIQRIRGFFGGISWMPFRKCCWPYLKGISLVAEYDATPYKSCKIEKHPKGRIKRTPFNVGLKYRLWDTVDLSASYVRGAAFAFSASAFYNFGMTKGFLPKLNDPLPYRSPMNIEPIGYLRPEDAMVQDFLYAMRSQGIDLLKVTITDADDCQKELRLYIENDTYRTECELRERIDGLLAYLTPTNIERVIVVVETEGFPVQEYRYCMSTVRAYANKEICAYELHVLNPLCEVNPPRCDNTQTLFKCEREICAFNLYPRTRTLFGSSKGKFKYSLGLGAVLEGFFAGGIYYSVRIGYTFLSDMGHLRGTDCLNPSQLPNVRTDVIRYFRHKGFTLDEAYLQKNWNMGHGWFSRVSFGYFEVEYAGLATEFLYYPLHSCWAVGVEGAVFKKRNICGLGFTNKVRQLHGFKPSYHSFNFYQYFLNFYYRWIDAKIDFSVNAGKFLANDYGARFEVARYFPSGLRIALWYTLTNGHDKVNGHTYYDKGISFSMPLDMFYMNSSCARWGYGMSAWLRDVGVTAETGQGLYEVIREQRNNW